MTQPTQTIRVPYKNTANSDPEFDNTVRIAIGCANLGTTVVGGQSTDAKNVNQCVSLLEQAAVNGWTPHFQAVLLALRQQPVIAANGEDNAKNLARQITTSALKVPEKTADGKPVHLVGLCVDEANCTKDTPTLSEINIATAANDKPATPAMNNNRALPITRSIAAINGVGDALMNSSRFLGKKPDGSDMSIEETVTAMRAVRAPATTESNLRLCLKNDPSVTIPLCAGEGARKGLGLAADTGIRYDGSTFLGTQAQPAGAKRASMQQK